MCQSLKALTQACTLPYLIRHSVSESRLLWVLTQKEVFITRSLFTCQLSAQLFFTAGVDCKHTWSEGWTWPYSFHCSSSQIAGKYREIKVPIQDRYSMLPEDYHMVGPGSQSSPFQACLTFGKWCTAKNPGLFIPFLLDGPSWEMLVWTNQMVTHASAEDSKCLTKMRIVRFHHPVRERTWFWVLATETWILQYLCAAHLVIWACRNK